MKRPTLISKTDRDFKRQKRREFKEVAAAIKKLRHGCYWLPKDAYTILASGFRRIEEAHNICRKWWKNC